MKLMKKYYSKIGNDHFRFCAINILAARKTAESIAKTTGALAWAEPVIYDTNLHTQYFWEYAA